MDTSRTLFNFSDSINVQIVDQNIQNMQTYHNRILLLRFLALYNSYFATQLCTLIELLKLNSVLEVSMPRKKKVQGTLFF